MFSFLYTHLMNYHFGLPSVQLTKTTGNRLVRIHQVMQNRSLFFGCHYLAVFFNVYVPCLLVVATRFNYTVALCAVQHLAITHFYRHVPAPSRTYLVFRSISCICSTAAGKGDATTDLGPFESYLFYFLFALWHRGDSSLSLGHCPLIVTGRP
jgi:hypothetical protein